MTSAKLGTLLPEFPTPNQLILPAHVDMAKVNVRINNKEFYIDDMHTWKRLKHELRRFFFSKVEFIKLETYPI